MDRRNFITQSGRLLALAGAVPSATAPSALSGLKEQTNVPLTSIHRIEADGLTVFPGGRGRDAPASRQKRRLSPALTNPQTFLTSIRQAHNIHRSEI